ncbi:MAG: tail fiber domain-containing protein [Myxococcales bacterium]|nr:tail fiber domain-containing protein [Myxococcales bacterium]MCB9705048.1 tail fiber domain-containing protein [Myxococcales bacterium]
MDEGGSCAQGEACCDGLQCCQGVPVPPGKEFCSMMCPISDRNLKSDLREVDPAAVLAKVVALPISTWRYTKDSAEVRHLGPMAQDFAAAFGLWDTDRMIFPLDASGVSMAAIQGLHQRLVDAEEENLALRRRLVDLEARLDAVEAGAR